MIPYLVINGVSSRQIQGLMIQSLAPITKPPKRTSIEEVDGRDGDIVEVLGYGAYDKAVSIGLHGNYNVDDVIKFFDTSGKVIFSNEADKYYNFAIYDQIDFEKLIKFKTAIVNFHVQPFKYDADAIAINQTLNNGGALFNVRNIGNIYSKPKLQMTGTGTVKVLINDTEILNINLSNNQTIIIDEMNAVDLSGNYLNRNVSGDYSDVKLNVGLNKVEYQGILTSASIDKYSRWI